MLRIGLGSVFNCLRLLKLAGSPIPLRNAMSFTYLSTLPVDCKILRQKHVIHISGVPASGKDTTIYLLLKILELTGVRYEKLDFTGFHYINYLLPFTVLTLLGTINKTNSRKQRNLYDYLSVDPKLVYILELLSLAIKILIMKLKIMRSRVLIINEGLINTMFYYIIFFRVRNSDLWKHLLKFLIALYFNVFRDYKHVFIVLNVRYDVYIRRRITRKDPLAIYEATRVYHDFTKLEKIFIKLIEYMAENLGLYVKIINADTSIGMKDIINTLQILVNDIACSK